MIDDLMEFIFELLFEGMLEATKSKKVPRIIRYLLIFIIVSFFLAVIGLIIYIGIYFLKKNLFISLLFILLALFFLIGGIVKFKKLYLKKQ